MASEIVAQIRRELARYLGGEIELYQFEDFFVPLLWDIDERGAEATEMAGRIHNLTAEYSRGDRSLDSLREELTQFVCPFGTRGAPGSQVNPYMVSEPREVELNFAPRKPAQREELIGQIRERTLVYRAQS